MIYAKKYIYSKSEHLSKYSGHIEGKRSSGSTKSAMINTQGNTLQGRATRKKKYAGEDQRGWGGGNRKTTPKPKKEKKAKKSKRKKKKLLFFLSHPKGWKHLRVCVLSVVHWRCWHERGGRRSRPSSRLGSTTTLKGCNILPRGGVPKDASKMACEQRKAV